MKLLKIAQKIAKPVFVKSMCYLQLAARSSGIVSACGAVGHEIESRRCIGWQFIKMWATSEIFKKVAQSKR
jgi:hypothetical protein